jgi:hypothetical protein
VYAEYEQGDRELYDLQTDPYELQNLAGRTAYASVESALRFRLHKLEGCAGPDCLMKKPDPAAP